MKLFGTALLNACTNKTLIPKTLYSSATSTNSTFLNALAILLWFSKNCNSSRVNCSPNCLSAVNISACKKA